MSISGKVLDMDYAKVLARNKDLNLEEIIMLDKVQKKKVLPKQEELHLKGKGLIEGRRPNFIISLKVAKQTGQKADYTKNKAFDNQYYRDLIEKAIDHHMSLDRSDVDGLLWEKLPDWMSDRQKKSKINNLLSDLRMKGHIENKGSDAKPVWCKR